MKKEETISCFIGDSFPKILSSCDCRQTGGSRSFFFVSATDIVKVREEKEIQSRTKRGGEKCF